MECQASLHREVAWQSSVCDVLVSTQKVVGLGWLGPGVSEWLWGMSGGAATFLLAHGQAHAFVLQRRHGAGRV